MNLQEDIDLPLVKSIAYFNLMGIKTYWACCGYNYPEQLPHKSHQLGQLNISMEFTPKAADICIRVLATNPGWFLKCQLVNPNLKAFILFYNIPECSPGWDEKSIHYHEIPSQIICSLERLLLSFKDTFKEETVLEDTNHLSKQTNEYWAYPARDPWIIRKADYIK